MIDQLYPTITSSGAPDDAEDVRNFFGLDRNYSDESDPWRAVKIKFGVWEFSIRAYPTILPFQARSEIVKKKNQRYSLPSCF